MSEYNENCNGFGSGVKPSRIINSIGGKQRKQTRGGLTFSPDWMILPKTNNNTNLPLIPLFFLLYQTVQMQFINTSSIVIKSQIVANSFTIFYNQIKYNNSLQSFVQI